MEATLAAATQLRVLIRSSGVEGVPGVRVRRVPDRGPDEVELVIEDRREQGDEVLESRGIRFYMDADMARELRDSTLDLSGRAFVFAPAD